MRPRSTLLSLVAAAMLIAASCSSTTTVQAGERALPAPTASQADDPTPVAASDAADPETADSGGASNDTASDDTASDDTDSENTDPDDTASDDTDPDDFPGIVGSDGQIESLVGDCQAGNDQACDILYQVTEFGSVEESIALDCGGRGEPATAFCTEGVVSQDGGVLFDEESSALPDIAEDCESGDMTACDFLYFRSPLGSDYETLGNSCAGLTEVAIPDCRTQFGN